MVNLKRGNGGQVRLWVDDRSIAGEATRKLKTKGRRTWKA